MYSTTFVKTKDAAGTKNEMGFGDRVLQTLEQQGRTKNWLAEQIGISKQAINYLLHHSSNPKYVNEIAEFLEVSPEWLLLGKGARQTLSEEDVEIVRIPVLALSQVMDYLTQKNSNTKYPYTHIAATSSVSSACFAMTLESASMEPLFNQGSLLIFNSDLTPKSKDFIIFYHLKDKEIYFRQYLVDGKDIYLKACDAMFSVFKNADIQMLGVLIESRNTFK